MNKDTVNYVDSQDSTTLRALGESDWMTQEIKRRATLFISDNYQNLTPEELKCAHLIIESAMMIGGLIVFEFETLKEQQGSEVLA